MQLPELCIKRPVFATVMSLMIVLLGVISFDRLTVREYPRIDTPVVSVRTVYKGASAQVIESQVTQPLEDSLSGIEGVRTLKSVSREEVSQITIEFVTERDVDAAANDVRDRVARVRAKLPDAADESVVSKIEADAQAIMWLAFFSDRHDALELSDYVDRYVADRLKTLPGVASVMVGGERKYAMRLWIDRERLAAYALTVQDVESALRRQNVELPAGRIESTQREFTVLAESDLRTVEQFNRMILTESRGYPVRLRDVGHAQLGALDERKVVRVNGNPAVGLGVVKQSTANTLEVARAVKREIERVREALPEGMSLRVAFDSSIFIERSIDSVYKVLGEAVLLVVLVIFVFLRSVRSTLIPFVTIPVSLVGAFFFLYLLGFSINVLTLLGVVLAVGLVVDDAIVVLENCHRHIELGKTPRAGSIDGSREIAFAVMAMSITLVAVFAPLGFQQGRTGRLFTEFALTVAGAVAVSGFVALTLTPMMCSRILKGHERHGRVYQAMERFFAGMTAAYRGALGAVLGQRWIVGVVFVAILGGAAATFLALKKELSPLEDRGFFLSWILAPEGASMEYTDRNVRAVERLYADIPEIVNTFAVVAPGLEPPNPVNLGVTFSQLKPWEERMRRTQDITAELRPKLFGSLPGVLAFPIDPPSLGQSFRDPPVQFVVQAPTYEDLGKAGDALLAEVRKSGSIVNADTDLKLDKPQLAVDIDREKAAAIGVDIDTIGRTLETLLGGRQVTRFKREGKQYDVMVQLEAHNRNTPADLTAIYVRSRDGRLVQLSNLVTVRETVAAKELNHFDRARALRLSANVAPGRSLGEALDSLEQAADRVLPKSARTALDGQSREFRESGATLLLTFALALAFIYLVLAAQFESFVSPFIIMLTVPLAALGALAALWATGNSLNVYSQIGLVMLIGLITKNGILIVEFANQLREQGLGRIEAVIESSTLRLRPILMTSLATVLGALPLALAAGAGSEARQAIGWVVVGGLSVGTLFTLFVIPTAYTVLVRDARASPARAPAPIKAREA
ncbi:MAG: efflux RND transporter permease subunit [Betaproteobacteria bacterium]|nr:efflux RND transporter permease subunit [Betaproteobacteria bacterium]MDH5351578.1 efflux RND transporter permease subunit [Betaproteobacteria bacterium]